jgi:hypothetical protein
MIAAKPCARSAARHFTTGLNAPDSVSQLRRTSTSL